MAEAAKVLIDPFAFFLAILILLDVSDLDNHLPPSSLLHVDDSRNHVIIEISGYSFPLTPHAGKAFQFHIYLRSNVTAEMTILLKFSTVNYSVIGLVCVI
jgi:hypothetical protein